MSPSGADAGMHAGHVRMVAADSARFQFHTEHHAGRLAIFFDHVKLVVLKLLYAVL
jgi:hypothetical protein